MTTETFRKILPAPLWRYQWVGWLLLAAVGVHLIESLARIGDKEIGYLDLWFPEMLTLHTCSLE